MELVRLASSCAALLALCFTIGCQQRRIPVEKVLSRADVVAAVKSISSQFQPQAGCKLDSSNPEAVVAMCDDDDVGLILRPMAQGNRTRAMMAEQAIRMRDAWRQAGLIAEETPEVACEVGGALTSCWHIQVHRDKIEGHAYLGVGRVGQHNAILSCSYFGRADAIPPVCSAYLKVRLQ